MVRRDGKGVIEVPSAKHLLAYSASHVQPQWDVRQDLDVNERK